MQPISNGRKKKMNKETHRFTRQGIEIEANYNLYGYAPYAHLEIKSINPERAPLPMTETGYKSHLHTQGTIEACEGGVVGQVTAWLDEEAKKPEWKVIIEASRQGVLF
jgi:hypothetical protein